MRFNTFFIPLIIFFLICGVGPGSLPAQAQTAKELFDEGGRFAEKGDFDKAQQSFDQAVQMDPSLAGLANFRLGVASAQHQHFEKAIGYYEKALSFKSNETVVYMNMANAYLALRRPDKAIESYNKIITADPKAVWAFHNLGSLYLQQQMYPSAIEAFNKVIEIDPVTYRTVYEQLGYAYQMARNYGAAIPAYQKAIEMNPKSFTAHYNLGKCYFDIKEADKAIQAYLAAIDLEPKSAEAITNLGHAYYNKYTNLKMRNDLDLASAAFNRALLMKKNLGPALFGMALVYREREDYQKALEMTERAKQSGLSVSPQFIENLRAKIDKKPADGDTDPKQPVAAETKGDSKKTPNDDPLSKQVIPPKTKENSPTSKS